MAVLSLSGYIGSGKDTVGKIIQYLTAGYTGSDCYRRLLNNEEITGHHNSEWQIKKWADPLRKVAAVLLNMDLDFLYTDEFKQMVLPECWSSVAKKPGLRQDGLFGNNEMYIKPMTGREFLQILGTNCIRDGLHPNAWVNALMGQYKGWTEKYWTPAEGYGEGYSHAACKECGNKFTGWKRQVRCQECNEKTPTVYPNWIISDTRFPNELAAVKEKNGITLKINRPCKECGMLKGHKMDCNAGRNLHSSETSLDDATFDYTINNTGTIEELIEEVRKFLKHYNII